MEFAPPTFDIAELKRKMDMRGLTILIAAENVFQQGRFYMLWRNGNFMVIQAEPWWRPGFTPSLEISNRYSFLEEHRALWNLQEVIQTMVDTIVIDGRNNWARLVRKRDNSYRLMYEERQLVPNCDTWTKVVELDDIEITRFVSGLWWEGNYEGNEVDISIGWQDTWGKYVSAECRGQKLVQSRGVGHYFFNLLAHVSQNGVLVGIMKEALVGRCATPTDRSAVFGAVADIQRHGVFFCFQIHDIYITEQGVRFADACSAKYYSDRDALAEQAGTMWETLADFFDHMPADNHYWLSGSRSMGSIALIIPRLPSPSCPMTMTHEEAIIRWVWSISTSDDYFHSPDRAFAKLYSLFHSSKKSATHHNRWIKGDNRVLLPFDNLTG